MKRMTRYTVECIGGNGIVVNQDYYIGGEEYRKRMKTFMHNVEMYQAMQAYAVEHGRAVSAIACELNTHIGNHVHQFVAVIDEQARLHIGSMYSR